jgi:hypothetical protein
VFLAEAEPEAPADAVAVLEASVDVDTDGVAPGDSNDRAPSVSSSLQATVARTSSAEQAASRRKRLVMRARVRESAEKWGARRAGGAYRDVHHDSRGEGVSDE